MGTSLSYNLSAVVFPGFYFMSILIVEDSETISSLLSMMLSNAGYEDVIIVASGEEALDILVECEMKPRLECGLDLVLMDIVLPGIDGLDVCRQMAEMGHVATIPVIFVTAQSEERVMAEAFEAGGWDFMVKPIASFGLLVRVKAAIRKRRDLEKRIVAMLLEEKG